MMERPTVKFTYQDYLQLPDDGRRWELIEGDLYLAPAPTWMHQTVVANLFHLLRGFVSQNDLGYVRFAPLDVYLSEENVVQPDLIFISHQRAEIITEASVRGAPDLVVEVASPATADRDRGIKARLYARYGVREYWLLDPIAQRLTVLAATNDRFTPAGAYQDADLVRSPLLAGLSFPCRELFTPR